MSAKKFCVNGFKITIFKKPSFEAVGFSRFVRFGEGPDSIGVFLGELSKNGNMKKLADTLDAPQQIWVCLSGSENSGADCRCTVCVEKTDKHDFSKFEDEELFTLNIPESEWADYEVGNGQSFTDLHKNDVYKMICEIGYDFNGKVELHFDNEHEESLPNKELHFILPVICK